MYLIVYVIRLLINLLTLLIVVHVVLTYFLSPFHPFREAIDRLVEPMLMPIRRFMPNMGGLDFSPIVLILIIQVVGGLLINLLVF